MIDYPLASIVVLCRNERHYIAACLDSLLATDYPGDRLEILVVDGMSTDGTRDIVAGYMQRHSCVRLLENPKKITPSAMNIGVQGSKGKVIFIVGAHATYDPHYISECVRHLLEYDADEAGAVAKYLSRDNTAIGQAITMVLAHPLGAGANVKYKTGAKEPTWVDTVSSGCYRRDVFDRIGYFNEKLTFSQDIEFNTRLRRAGGRILLVPTATIRYYARSDMQSFCRHNFRNGVWSILPAVYSSIMPVSWRHLVPLAFVSAILGSTLLALIWPAMFWVLAGILALYFSVLLISGAQVALRRKDARYLFLMPVAFACLHFAYGLGSLWGAVRAIGIITSRSPLIQKVGK